MFWLIFLCVPVLLHWFPSLSPWLLFSTHLFLFHLITFHLYSYPQFMGIVCIIYRWMLVSPRVFSLDLLKVHFGFYSFVVHFIITLYFILLYYISHYIIIEDDDESTYYLLQQTYLQVYLTERHN